ncbi:MAG TPA: type II toxin-antitoxin system RelE/ParE family toxin [Thermoanaerobaculia bacterium]|nr:type II toxin-antitoxin system RelE/ParE family toxin [Thermoanaerobaculia bacterium]
MNRPAAPNAIREDFESMAKILASTPGIGRLATYTKTRNVRQMFLRRVGFVIYYRVSGSPPYLEILAFWHSRRGKGPPI